MIGTEENREKLRAQYRAAFGTWAAQVHHSRQVSNEIEKSDKLDAALNAYREARNRLVADLARKHKQSAGC